ncbi:MAG: aminotransferase class V-fold PLP-dependent enzyme [Bradymonadaceae bacterium]|nr:aminotransferase class V-fold PLP-dependent enzyme [Lujinxingiaceae bacterium]
MNEDDPIYLDHNATTPILAEAVDAMLPYLQEHFGNPSSSHVYGQRAHAALERAREQVATLIKCQPDEVIFTSGGTEANNLAIRGVVSANTPNAHVITSVIEHPATARPCAWLEQQGHRVSRISVDQDGRLRLAMVEAALAEVAGAVPGLALNGHRDHRLPNTLNVRFPRVAGPALLSLATDVAASTGSACHEGHDQPSPVILAMGLSPDQAMGSVRLTLGRSTNETNVLRAADILASAWSRLTPVGRPTNNKV